MSLSEIQARVDTLSADGSPESVQQLRDLLAVLVEQVSRIDYELQNTPIAVNNLGGEA